MRPRFVSRDNPTDTAWLRSADNYSHRERSTKTSPSLPLGVRFAHDGLDVFDHLQGSHWPTQGGPQRTVNGGETIGLDRLEPTHDQRPARNGCDQPINILGAINQR